MQLTPSDATTSLQQYFASMFAAMKKIVKQVWFVLFIGLLCLDGAYAIQNKKKNENFVLLCKGEATFDGKSFSAEKIVKIIQISLPAPYGALENPVWQIVYDGEIFNDYSYLQQNGTLPEDLSGLNKVSVDEYQILAVYRSPRSEEVKMGVTLKISRLTGTIFYSRRIDGQSDFFKGVCKKELPIF